MLRAAVACSCSSSRSLLLPSFSFVAASSSGVSSRSLNFAAFARESNPQRGSNSRVASATSVTSSDRRRKTTSSIVAMATSSEKTIGTHNGSFHCDEALGVALLRRTAAYEGAKVVRSRNQEVLDKCDVVIDVGGVYDAVTNRFDHHQKTFNDVFGHGFNTRLSSAGLVYKHFGREVVAKLMSKFLAEKAAADAARAAAGAGGANGNDTAAPALPSPPSDADVEIVYLAVYKNFMEAVDAIDNGVDQFEGAGEPRYVSQTHLSARVGGLNPFWNEDQSDAAVDVAFERAVALTAADFEDAVRQVAVAWLPAREVVASALDSAADVDGERGEIIELPTPCQWKEHLMQLERERGIQGKVKFVIFEDERAKNWRVQAVSLTAASFINRVSLPASIRGLRDADLDAAAAKLPEPNAAPPGGVFVHVAGFIGGHATREGALCYARAALAEEEQRKKEEGDKEGEKE